MKTKLLLSGLLLGFSGFSTLAQTHDYPNAQHLSTRFLGAQRCGATNSWMHGACHTKDGEAVGKDLSGGWHDCGDYIKFHHTGPYAAIMYLIGYDYFPEVYPDNYSQSNSAGSPNGIPDILDEVKIETDYLIKGVQNGTVYWQVGGAEDHNSFSEPVTNSTEKNYNGGTSAVRPVFSTTSGYSNACGDAAAALALMSIVYKKFDATYAATCLTKAIEYYNVGKISPASSNAEPLDFYSFTDYKDEMGLAAITIYRANNTASYLTDATTYSTGFNTAEPLFYGNVSWLAYLQMYKATGTASYLSKVTSHINGVKTKNATCGYYHYDNWGSLVYAANEAFLASICHSINADAASYTFAKANVDFILGSHSTAVGTSAPANFSFVIGYNVLGGGAPKSPQHAASFGYKTNEDPWTKFTNEKNTPGSVPFKYPLNGALVGGPKAKCASYVDNIDDYVANEVCTYYNAGLTGAIAYINKIVNNVVTSSVKLENATEFQVYPNPSSEYITISNGDNTDDFEIIDNVGRLVLKVSVQNQDIISVSDLQNGVYYIKKVSDNKVKIFVKQ